MEIVVALAQLRGSVGPVGVGQRVAVAVVLTVVAGRGHHDDVFVDRGVAQGRPQRGLVDLLVDGDAVDQGDVDDPHARDVGGVAYRTGQGGYIAGGLRLLGVLP